MSKRFHVASAVSARIRVVLVLAAVATVGFLGCARDDASQGDDSAKPGGASTTRAAPTVQPGVGFQRRFGDEIVVAGHLYRIGTPVVTWMDPGGFDAYRTDKRFGPVERAGYGDQVRGELTSAAATTQRAATRAAAAEAAGRPVPPAPDPLPSPSRYNLRYGADSIAYLRDVTTRPALADESNWASPTTKPFTAEQLQQVRGGGWTLELLQDKVDQFVLHYDVAGTSETCFRVLQDQRNLSVQFMLDLDGTIYQTLDLKERAFHATKSNSRSIGIEIANMGSYGGRESIAALEQWYKRDESGQTYIKIPDRLGGLNSQRSRPSVLRPARDEMVVGQIRGSTQRQYDLTPQQYAALIKLTAALCDVFPKIKCDYPREADGSPLWRTLTSAEYNGYGGVLGHYHVQDNKSDPGPAFQWEHVINGAQNELAARRRPTLAAQ